MLICVFAWLDSSVLLIAEYHCILYITWICYSLFIHLHIEGYLGCFQFLAMDKAVINICLQVFLQRCFQINWVNIERVQFLNCMVKLCLTLKKLVNCLLSGCAILHFHQQQMSIFVIQCLHQQLVLSFLSHLNRCVVITLVFCLVIIHIQRKNTTHQTHNVDL